MVGRYIAMNCPIRSGSSSVRCYPSPCADGSGWTTEHDKAAESYQAAVPLASLLIWA